MQYQSLGEISFCQTQVFIKRWTYQDWEQNLEWRSFKPSNASQLSLSLNRLVKVSLNLSAFMVDYDQGELEVNASVLLKDLLISLGLKRNSFLSLTQHEIIEAPNSNNRNSLRLCLVKPQR